MKLNLITPVKWVEETALLPGRFCIAPVAAKEQVYFEYFRAAAGRGYAVILDNGIFEGKVLGSREYCELAFQMGAKIIVCPDSIGAEWDANHSNALKFRDLACDRWHGWTNGPLPEFMIVPQCRAGDLEGGWTAINTAFAAGFEYIGICRDLCYNMYGQLSKTTDQELNRFLFSADLQRAWPIDKIMATKWHFLGVGNQVHMLQHYWFVDSMDTASFFWGAANGEMIRNGVLNLRVKRPDDYFTRQYTDRIAVVPPPGSSAIWAELREFLQRSCRTADEYATMAMTRRHELLKDRI